jgi:hypothetical protein
MAMDSSNLKNEAARQSSRTAVRTRTSPQPTRESLPADCHGGADGKLRSSRPVVTQYCRVVGVRSIAEGNGGRFLRVANEAGGAERF